MFESDSSNNGISKSMETPIKRKVRVNMNQSSNKSTKCSKNIDHEPDKNYVKLLRKE